MKKAKASKDLVTIGTHIPLVKKLSLESMVEAKGTTIYSFLQKLILDALDEFDQEIQDLKTSPSAETTGDDLL